MRRTIYFTDRTEEQCRVKIAKFSLQIFSYQKNNFPLPFFKPTEKLESKVYSPQNVTTDIEVSGLTIRNRDSSRVETDC